jgi:radical SAM protein (TIGR01212 family)
MIGPWLRRRLGTKVSKIGLNLNLGCPIEQMGQRCLYCSPLASGKSGEPGSISRQLHPITCKGQNERLWLAYFQAHTSTNASASYLRPYFYEAAFYPGIRGIIISTRPDCLSHEHWRLLAELRRQGLLCWLELGLQSAHDHTLELIGRGHNVRCFAQALRSAQDLDIPVVAHVILGLPGEDIRHTNFTASWLAEQNIWGVKLHSLMVLKDTGLEKMWREGRFIPWTLEQWISACAAFVSRLPDSVTIHRLSADPGPEQCLAPAWIKHKANALNMLGNFMEKNNITQGREF